MAEQQRKDEFKKIKKKAQRKDEAVSQPHLFILSLTTRFV